MVNFIHVLDLDLGLPGRKYTSLKLKYAFLLKLIIKAITMHRLFMRCKSKIKSYLQYFSRMIILGKPIRYFIMIL